MRIHFINLFYGYSLRRSPSSKLMLWEQASVERCVVFVQFEVEIDSVGEQ